MGEQRQGPGLVPGPGRAAVRGTRREVAQQQFDQAVRHVKPGQAGRLDDRPAYLLPGHGDQQDLAFLERGGQFRVAQRAVVEVGPQGQHHEGRAGQRADGRDEPMLLGLVPAGGEDLFELIHHDERPRAGAAGDELGRRTRVAAQRRLDGGRVGACCAGAAGSVPAGPVAGQCQQGRWWLGPAGPVAGPARPAAWLPG